jgi:hypothetical protein
MALSSLIWVYQLTNDIEDKKDSHILNDIIIVTRAAHMM